MKTAFLEPRWSRLAREAGTLVQELSLGRHHLNTETGERLRVSLESLKVTFRAPRSSAEAITHTHLQVVGIWPLHMLKRLLFSSTSPSRVRFNSTMAPMNIKAAADDFLDFVNASPTPFHAVKSMKDRLSAVGFKQIKVSKPLELNTSLLSLLTTFNRRRIRGRQHACLAESTSLLETAQQL